MRLQAHSQTNDPFLLMRHDLRHGGGCLQVPSNKQAVQVFEMMLVLGLARRPREAPQRWPGVVAGKWLTLESVSPKKAPTAEHELTLPKMLCVIRATLYGRRRCLASSFHTPNQSPIWLVRRRFIHRVTANFSSVSCCNQHVVGRFSASDQPTGQQSETLNNFKADMSCSNPANIRQAVCGKCSCVSKHYKG